MENIKAILEHCSAGIDFYASENRKDVPEELLEIISDAAIDSSHERYHHLCSCIKQCESIINSYIQASTYKQLVAVLLEHWDTLGPWTWPYRVLLDIVEMDSHCHSCSLKWLPIRHWKRVKRDLWRRGSGAKPLTR